MQVLCCDWLLEVRAGVWEASGLTQGTPPAPARHLRAFQRDLHSLRRLSQTLPVSTIHFYNVKTLCFFPLRYTRTPFFAEFISQLIGGIQRLASPRYQCE